MITSRNFIRFIWYHPLRGCNVPITKFFMKLNIKKHFEISIVIKRKIKYFVHFLPISKLDSVNKIYVSITGSHWFHLELKAISISTRLTLLYRQSHHRLAVFQIRSTDLVLHIIPGKLVCVSIILHRFLQRILHRHTEIIFEDCRCNSNREFDHENDQERSCELEKEDKIKV